MKYQYKIIATAYVSKKKTLQKAGQTEPLFHLLNARRPLDSLEDMMGQMDRYLADATLAQKTIFLTQPYDNNGRIIGDKPPLYKVAKVAILYGKFEIFDYVVKNILTLPEFDLNEHWICTKQTLGPLVWGELESKEKFTERFERFQRLDRSIPPFNKLGRADKRRFWGPLLPSQS